jgi:hypothetical protein
MSFLTYNGHKLSTSGHKLTYTVNSVPTALTDGNTVAWYDYNQASTITKTGSAVSRWNDYLGSGHDLLQVTGAPLWSSNGITFNGISTVLKSAAFTLNQPEFIYIVFNQTTWNTIKFIFDGNTSNTGGLVQYGTTPQLIGYAGGSIVENAGFTLGTFGIARLLLYGSNSKLIVNNGTPTTGNFGAANMGGFTVGREGTTGVGDYCWFNGTIKEIIIRKVSDTSGDETAIYNYLKTKYSL